MPDNHDVQQCRQYLNEKIHGFEKLLIFKTHALISSVFNAPLIRLTSTVIFNLSNTHIYLTFMGVRSK